MEIEVRTDRHVAGDEGLIDFVRERVATQLGSYARQITAVEVHLREESGARKGPPELTCMVEVRLAGSAPVVVRRRAPSKDEVIASALDGVRGALGRLLGRLDTVHAGAETIRHTS
jgi:hypothetical protein